MNVTNSLSERDRILKVSAIFGDENLGFSVVKHEVQLSVLDSLAILGWVEDVANNGAIRPWSVWLNVDIASVRQANEEVTSWERVDIVKHVSFLKVVAPNLVSFSCLVDGSSHLVDVWTSVERVPHDLSVLGIVASSELLLRPIIIEWDSRSSQGKY